MPEVLGNPPSPRTALFWNGTQWQWALVDAAGQLQVDVIASGLPAGAATAAAQALALAQLQLIEDMRDALQSVATDRLIVRGEDQLFSFRNPVTGRVTAAISGANGYVQANTPAAGRIWEITTVAATDRTTAITDMQMVLTHGAVDTIVHRAIRAFAIGEHETWAGHLWLDDTSVLRAYFIGGLVADSCRIEISGYEMTEE